MAKQFLERMCVIRVGDDEASAVYLEGLYHAGNGCRSAVLAPPTPGSGGNMDHPVLAEMCWRLSLQGIPTLRFNWRRSPVWSLAPSAPTHASLGRAEAHGLGQACAAADLVAAISLQVDTHANPCIVIGFGAGFSVLAQVAAEHPAVDTLIGVAPRMDEVRAVAPLIGKTQLTTLIFTGASAHDTQSVSLPRVDDGFMEIHHIAEADPAFIRGLSTLGSRVGLAVESLPPV